MKVLIYWQDDYFWELMHIKGEALMGLFQEGIDKGVVDINWHDHQNEWKEIENCAPEDGVDLLSKYPNKKLFLGVWGDEPFSTQLILMERS